MVEWDLLVTPLDGRMILDEQEGYDGEWVGCACGMGRLMRVAIGLSFFIGPDVAPNNIFFSLFKRVCMLNFKFQICKNMNLFDMISFDLKAH